MAAGYQRRARPLLGPSRGQVGRSAGALVGASLLLAVACHHRVPLPEPLEGYACSEAMKHRPGAWMDASAHLSDYTGTETIAYLPRKLSTDRAPAGVDPSVGDFTYYVPWGNLAIFYEDSGYASGLVAMGRVESGLEKLAAVERDVTVTIQKIDGSSR